MLSLKSKTTTPDLASLETTVAAAAEAVAKARQSTATHAKGTPKRS